MSPTVSLFGALVESVANEHIDNSPRAICLGGKWTSSEMAWPNVYSLDTHRLQRRPIARARPTILIAHDAFHIPAHFEQLQQELANAGFKAIVPQLPSSGITAQSSTLEDDIQTLVMCGQSEIDDGSNVLLMAHGYGSIPGCAAAERLNRYSLDRPRTGHVSKLILIAGVISRPNESYYDSVEASWAVARDGLVGVLKPETIFYNDCPPEVTSTALTHMRPQSEGSLWAKSTSIGRSSIPTLYMVCEVDQAIAPTLQRSFVRMLQSVNRHATMNLLQTGHCPFLSRTREVGELIAREAME